MKYTYATVLILFAATGLFANGSRLASQDAFAVARGYAVTAGISSPAAVYYNPAGLADVDADAVSGGVYVVRGATEFHPAGGGATVDERGKTFLMPHLFAAVPLAKDFVLGAGLYAPFGQSTDWQPSSGFAGLATFNEIKFLTGSVALAYRMTQTFTLGATVQYSHASVDLNRALALAPGVVSSFGYKGNGDAASASIGAKWIPAAGHTIGVKYQRKTDMNFSGTANVPGYTSAPGSLGWVFPDDLSIGWQWDFATGWQSEISYDRTFWHRLKTVHLNAGVLSTAVPLNWMDSSYWSIGFTRKVAAELSISAGYCYSENSVPDSTFSPSLPDVNRHLLNAGVFWRHDHVTIGLAAQRGISPTRNVAGSHPDGLGGSAAGGYSNSLWGGDLSGTLHF